MGRSYTPTQVLLLDQRIVIRCELIEIIFDAETILRYNTSQWDLVYGADTFFGVGDAIRVQLPEEDATLAANPCTIYLSSTNSALTSFVLSTPMTNRIVNVYDAIFDPATYQIFGAPLQEFSGFWSHAELVNLPNEDASNG